MSNEKTTQTKPEKAKSDKAKKPSFFSKVGRYFRDLKSEFKKIVWPSKKQIINNTVVVLICMAITGVAIWILDWAFINLFALIY
ncbi:preprotein translocase subunit SecE [Phocea massiliensis]|uniref:Protein translocase subunit SecE n=1 Tax=Merdimmobilis hominis TaxID=2897707 RepID=A0A938X8U4_9FIRM|nr:preprotein translocase subunit SecE [Merdimmobilis hominis]MBM6920764.1 preprotein translocase subunit SecE [Merdimmobilis hominis]